MRYKCPMCGYIFDEEKEGKTIDELDVCPMCGVPADTFIPVDENDNEVIDVEATKLDDDENISKIEEPSQENDETKPNQEDKNEKSSEHSHGKKGGHGHGHGKKGGHGHSHGKEGGSEHGGESHGHGHRHQYGKKRKEAQKAANQIKSTLQNTTKRNVSPDEIKKWFELLKEGAITQEEYDQKKKELL